MRDAPFTIGQLSRTAGTPVATVRYYERHGLLPAPARGANGYRRYGDDAVAQLAAIARAKALGFTLAEIRALIELEHAPGATCGDVARAVERRLARVASEIERLEEIRARLERLQAAWPCPPKRPLRACRESGTLRPNPGGRR